MTKAEKLFYNKNPYIRWSAKEKGNLKNFY